MLTEATGPAVPTLATTYGAAAQHPSNLAGAPDARLPHRDPTQLRFDAPVEAVNAAFDRLACMIEAHAAKAGGGAGGGGNGAGPSRGTDSRASTQPRVSTGSVNTAAATVRTSARGGGGASSLGGFESAAEDEASFFLTGVRGEGGSAARAGDAAAPPLDATAQLIRQLGIDVGDGLVELPPRRGHNMMGGGDASTALKALKYALDHPLLGDFDARVGPKPNHLKMTESIGARMKPAMGKVAAAAALALEGQGTVGSGRGRGSRGGGGGNGSRAGAASATGTASNKQMQIQSIEVRPLSS